MPIRLIRVEHGGPGADIEMHWSSIFTGAFLTLGFGVFFVLLGNAIGLNLANTVSAGVSGALKFFSWLYMAVTLVFSFFLGAYLCTRSARIESPTSGVLHGLASWGLATSIILIGGSIAAFGVRVLLSGLANDAANWLAVCIVGFGGLFAALGGLAGKYSVMHGGQEVTRPEIETRRVG